MRNVRKSYFIWHSFILLHVRMFDTSNCISRDLIFDINTVSCRWLLYSINQKTITIDSFVIRYDKLRGKLRQFSKQQIRSMSLILIWTNVCDTETTYNVVQIHLVVCGNSCRHLQLILSSLNIYCQRPKYRPISTIFFLRAKRTKVFSVEFRHNNSPATAFVIDIKTNYRQKKCNNLKVLTYY